MVVIDRFFDNAAVRRELNQKYPTLMKKANPVKVIFKDKPHFDVQNPIIGLLAAQVMRKRSLNKWKKHLQQKVLSYPKN